MPELPEVETICQGLNRFTSGLIIKKGEVLLPRTLAYPNSLNDFQRAIQENKIINWMRRGKYLLAKLSQGWLVIHLRMTGQLLWLSQDASLHKHCRIRLFFEENKELRFVDTRTFGKFWYVSEAESLETVVTGLQKLGLEPFSADFSVEYLTINLAKTRRAIKTVLLDQSFVAGIGNIYADEVLFKSKIHPQMMACELTLSQIKILKKAIVETLQTAIKEGGTTFSDFLQVTGINGNYGNVAWVYKRNNQPCRICQTPIERIKLGGRSTHFCPQCQNI
jgi:formamidopyrimidine-DNA glycosylase